MGLSRTFNRGRLFQASYNELGSPRVALFGEVRGVRGSEQCNQTTLKQGFD
jgi:hypothetical protein